MILAITSNEFIAGVVPVTVASISILVAIINQRSMLHRQNDKIQEVHVLVNQRLTDSLKVGQLLAAQLTMSGIEPIVSPGTGSVGTSPSTEDLAKILQSVKPALELPHSPTKEG